jgi:aminoglycoside phosphotransferase (APT) family kinase protein
MPPDTVTAVPPPFEERLGTIAADLRVYLRQRALGIEFDAASLQAFGDGHSGYTYAIDAIENGLPRPCVLRLSPPGARIAGPADVGRQGRIMAALGERGLSVPHVIACETNACIDGRAFVLMERVEGVPWQIAAADHSHLHVAEQTVASLKEIHALPTWATGIGDEQPVALQQELRHWSRLLSRAAVSLQRPAFALLEALERSRPRDCQYALVHGDYHYGNVLFRDGRLVAVLDWEIAEIGVPLLDLGCLAVASLRRRFRPEPNPTGSVEISVPDLFHLYGADPVDGGWYVAFSCFKYAAILSFNLQLHRAGKRHDAVYEELQNTMFGLIDLGLAIVDEGIGVDELLS